MKVENRIELYRIALSRYGIDAQTMVLVEECAELLNAIAKFKRKRVNKADIITELADVSIMVEQMALYYGMDDFISEKDFKLNRLKCRLDNRGKI